MATTTAPAATGTLSASQLAEFYQNGFVVLRSLVDPQTVEFAKRTIDDRIREKVPEVQYEKEALQGRNPESLTPEERILAVRGIHQQVFRDDRFFRLASYEPLLSALVSLLGPDIKVLQDMALIKPPHIGSEKPLHQDAAYFEVEPFDQIVGTWWALDAANEENGCMFVWPGTNRLPVVDHTEIVGTPHRVIDPALIASKNQLALPMASGDVLLFSSRLFHQTPPNRSDRRRRALQIHYASSNCRLLPGRKPRTYTLVHGESKPGGL